MLHVTELLWTCDVVGRIDFIFPHGKKKEDPLSCSSEGDFGMISSLFSIKPSLFPVLSHAGERMNYFCISINKREAKYL